MKQEESRGERARKQRTTERKEGTHKPRNEGKKERNIKRGKDKWKRAGSKQSNRK
jgi:hypothetical protein